MDMKQMTSGISTIPYQVRKAVSDTYRQSQRETTLRATPGISVAGVPGEYDFRKFLTGPFQNMMPVQTGANGEEITGTLALTTNRNRWREYDPGRFGGLNAPKGEYSSKPFYYTDLKQYPPDPDGGGQPQSAPVSPASTVDVPPSAAVVTSRTTTKNFSVSLIQDTDVF